MPTVTITPGYTGKDYHCGSALLSIVDGKPDGGDSFDLTPQGWRDYYTLLSHPDVQATMAPATDELPSVTVSQEWPYDGAQADGECSYVLYRSGLVELAINHDGTVDLCSCSTIATPSDLLHVAALLAHPDIQTLIRGTHE